MKKLAGLCLASWLAITTPNQAHARADVLALQEGYPQEYVVVKGDTLWDISGRFLTQPWRWPEIWGVNPQIDDPHWIYPGDVIYMTWVDGKPRLRIKGDNKLVPRARATPLENPIPAIPLKDMDAFMQENVVLDDELLAETPYVLGGRNKRIIAGAGDRIYARGEMESDHKYQNIYRPLQAFHDPTTDELLGYELSKIAEAYVVSTNDEDITTLELAKSQQEVRVMDRVLPAPETRIQSMFYPAPAPEETEGYILSVDGGVQKIGRFDAVAINKGRREGVKPGHVFIVYAAGEEMDDPVTGERVKLPDEEAGTLMVYKVYDKVSYALVMTALNVLSVGDNFKSPDL